MNCTHLARAITGQSNFRSGRDQGMEVIGHHDESVGRVMAFFAVMHHGFANDGSVGLKNVPAAFGDAGDEIGGLILAHRGFSA
jgi:hypothetical protein